MAQAKRYSAILMFGCPGSGKGTQGTVLGQFPNLMHLAMGDLFRSLDKTSPIGQESLSYSTRGILVPDELTVRLFSQHLDKLAGEQKLKYGYHTLILDGIPRTQAQVKLLENIVDVKSVIHLEMEDRDALVARLAARALKSNRPDDADRKVIEKRIEVYERETFPVLEMYPRKLIVRVNADQPPLRVLRDIAESLASVVPASI